MANAYVLCATDWHRLHRDGDVLLCGHSLQSIFHDLRLRLLSVCTWRRRMPSRLSTLGNSSSTKIKSDRPGSLPPELPRIMLWGAAKDHVWGTPQEASCLLQWQYVRKSSLPNESNKKSLKLQRSVILHFDHKY